MAIKIVNFLKEVKVEVKKVNWPSKAEIIRYTLLVIGVSLVIAVFLGGMDKLFQFALNNLIL